MCNIKQTSALKLSERITVNFKSISYRGGGV